MFLSRHPFCRPVQFRIDLESIEAKSALVPPVATIREFFELIFNKSQVS